MTASFLPGAQVLSVLGDAADNTIVISRDAAGKILVNGGAVTVKGGTPTVANTAAMVIFGLSGNDQITLDESNGALPTAQMFGGEGNDVLTGEIICNIGLGGKFLSSTRPAVAAITVTGKSVSASSTTSSRWRFFDHATKRQATASAAGSRSMAEAQQKRRTVAIDLWHQRPELVA